jgi:hypothetical protein
MRNSYSQGRPEKQSGTTQNADRRNLDRFPFSAVAEVKELASSARLSVRIADLGRHGCYADALNVFPVGTPIRLTIRHEGLCLETNATVVYSRSGMGMGLNYPSVPVDMESTLAKWLAEAGGNPAPAAEPAGLKKAITEPFPVERQILSRLITTMMSKRILDSSEGTEMLQELLKVE